MHLQDFSPELFLNAYRHEILLSFEMQMFLFREIQLILFVP